METSRSVCRSSWRRSTWRPPQARPTTPLMAACKQAPKQTTTLLSQFYSFIERKLREMLEAEFGEDLKDRKAVIRQEV